MRVYVMVAASIAAAAFGLGQLEPGAGMLFAAVASTGWVVWNNSRSSLRG
jgi:hypothetical protein